MTVSFVFRGANSRDDKHGADDVSLSKGWLLSTLYCHLSAHLFGVVNESRACRCH